MPPPSAVTPSQRLRSTIVGLTLGGMLLVLLRVIAVNHPLVGWFILGLCGCALAVALRPRGAPAIRRLAWYPVLLAGAYYLWETHLPPPTLPSGVLREGLLRLTLVGILTHLLAPHVQPMVRRSMGGAWAGRRRRQARPGSRAPRYWLLDLTLLLFLGGLVLVETQGFAAGAQQLAQATVCVGGVAMMVAWVISERQALAAEAEERAARQLQAALRSASPPRTPTQEHFLAVQRQLAEAPAPPPAADPERPDEPQRG